ncbi:MAG: class I SAM-dependent methyltransferase [bacterium]|nr:class I SAM-dependent methyltransferase [bacterium]MDD5353802.1 class I SAM-dependent methyltransferase [bacterium]MDD5756174.1 class I SAM-dependent methyltransferase [bacterium]
MGSNYKCVQCRKAIVVPSAGEGEMSCPHCGCSYTYAINYLKYNYDQLLFNKFKKKYLLNKILNNNGYLSYHFLKEISISSPDRPEVVNFKKFIGGQLSGGKILDVGCGVLECPGYLDCSPSHNFEFYGLDPIDDRSFRGMRVVGCAEYMPFPDNTFAAVVFATSVDHLCSSATAFRECRRVLNESGKVIIWMSDLRTSFYKRFRNKIDIIRESLRRGYRIDKFIVYPNFTVLYTPDWAVDPFHSHIENPKEIIEQMRKIGFTMTKAAFNNQLEVFLCFTKT